MQNDPYYERCCVTGEHRTRTKIDWHHNLIYAGRQVNEKWCILPLARWVHDKANRSDIKQYLDWIMLNRATDEDLDRYPKAKLKVRRALLNKCYENKENYPVL